ncbi:hypothetical protein NECAME_11029 [Necator americanus]|uniref:Uncharacterized protein n=1 Tax=Necator americanus TaxID=51031 RepID=W2T8W7_NECAM|nr:hypothetical protein NECAME_11029 [Necator americanus]ETN77432.1 hypothetical protein NECAME_11029 [Necator americanus]
MKTKRHENEANKREKGKLGHSRLGHSMDDGGVPYGGGEQHCTHSLPSIASLGEGLNLAAIQNEVVGVLNTF